MRHRSSRRIASKSVGVVWRAVSGLSHSAKVDDRIEDTAIIFLGGGCSKLGVDRALGFGLASLGIPQGIVKN